MGLTREQYTRSLNDKKLNNFYVTFFGFPENEGNILGRQVKSIERPTITFQTFEVPYKRKYSTDPAKLRFDPIQITFRDDEENLTQEIIYSQLFRQNGHSVPTVHNQLFDKAKFGIKVECFNLNDEIIETFELVNAYISGVTNSQMIYTDNQGTNEISCTVYFETINFKDINLSNTV